MEKDYNLAYKLQENALFWLKERPRLFEHQTQNPQDLISYLHGELDELIEALETPQNRQDILGEITDVANYVVQLIYVIQMLYGISDEEILGEAMFKYQFRNAYRYEKDLFQDGDPKEKRQLAQGLRVNREKHYGDELLGAMIENESGIY